MAATGNEVVLLSQLKRALEAQADKGLLYNVPVVLTANTTMSGMNFTLTIKLATSSNTDEVTLHRGDTVFVVDSSGDSFDMAAAGGIYELIAEQVTINSSSGTAALFAPIYTPDMADVDNPQIVKTTTHKIDYSKDTLEIVVDSTGKVTSMYFVSA